MRILPGMMDIARKNGMPDAHMSAVLEIVGQVLTPEMFGAKNDGSQDTARAFETLIAEIPPEGAAIELSAGATYLLDGPIIVPNDRPVVMIGFDGFPNGGAGSAGVTTLRRAPGGGYTGPLVEQNGPVSPTHGLRAKNVCFDGNGLAGTLVSLNGSNEANIAMCGFYNALGHGIEGLQFWNGTIENCRFFQIGDANNDLWAIYLGSNAAGITNTADILACQWEALTGGALWLGDNGALGRTASLVRVLGGKMEQSSNAYNTPFVRLSAASDVDVRGLFCINGMGHGATHIEVQQGSRIELDTHHATSFVDDAHNPQYFVDVQGTSREVKVRGTYYRGAGNGGAQVHIENTVSGFALADDNIHDSPLSGTAVLYGAATVLQRAAQGASGYYTQQAALGVGATILTPNNGVRTNLIASGNDNIVMGSGSDGQVLALVNLGGAPIRFNATDAVSLVKNGALSTVRSYEAATFVYSSALGMWAKLNAKRPSCRVTTTASVVVPNNAATTIGFDAETSECWDDDGMHDTVTNNSRITIVTPGRYRIGALIEWAANATGYRQLRIRRNGAGTLGLDTVNAVTTAAITTNQAVEAEVNCAAGDYFEVLVQQNSGGNLNAALSGSYSPIFFAERLD